MNTRAILASVLAAAYAALAMPAATFAQESADNLPQAQFVTDPTITTAVKERLAASRVVSLLQLTIDADRDGVVWLSGTTQTQEAADRAVDIARNAEGVVEVKSTIVVVRRPK